MLQTFVDNRSCLYFIIYLHIDEDDINMGCKPRYHRKQPLIFLSKTQKKCTEKVSYRNFTFTFFLIWWSYFMHIHIHFSNTWIYECHCFFNYLFPRNYTTKDSDMGAGQNLQHYNPLHMCNNEHLLQRQRLWLHLIHG